jgi:hypothetical protein
MSSILGVALLVVFLVILPIHVKGGVTIQPADTLPPVDDLNFSNTSVMPLVITSLASAQPGVDVNVSNLAGNLAGNESEVSIDVNPTNPNNLVIIGHQFPAQNVIVMNTFYTIDGGQNWNQVTLGNAQDGLTSSIRFDPTISFDDTGNVYVGYGVKTLVPGGLGATRVTVVVCRSTDGGQTYPQCVQIATTNDIDTDSDGDTNLVGNDKWHLATGPDPSNPSQQNVYIAWTQNITEGLDVNNDPIVDQRIVVSSSMDGGLTFSAPLIISDDSIGGIDHSLFADPAVGPNGELYVAWHDIDDNQILLDVSPDGGATFGADNLVTNLNFTGFKVPIPPQPWEITPGPTIDIDRSGGTFDGRLYITYTNFVNLPDTDIFVRFSNDGGSTWSTESLVNDDGGNNSQFLPWLDVDQQTGLVSVVWYDARNDANNQKVEVFVATSEDGGANFLPNILVSDGQSDQSTNNPNRYPGSYLEYIGIAVFDCEAFPVWADNSTNLADLDFFTEAFDVDITPPDIQCNTPATITPPDAPISFTATATDFCTDDPFVEIIGYDCFKFTKKGKRIDKTESCVVEIDGDTITIVDSGGVDDNITWTVRAVDNSGNVTESTCSTLVVKP